MDGRVRNAFASTTQLSTLYHHHCFPGTRGTMWNTDEPWKGAQELPRGKFCDVRMVVLMHMSNHLMRRR